MPSAARQRLPTELWKGSEPSNKSSVPSHYSFEIQAHPGNCEVPHKKAGSKSGSPAGHKFFKRQPTNRKNLKNLSRRGSSADIFRDQADSSLGDGQQAVSSSACSDSECAVSYNSTDCSDYFAVDSVKAPAVNALPLPPPEWLKVFPKKIDNVPAKNKSPFQFQAFLDKLVAAETERRV